MSEIDTIMTELVARIEGHPQNPQVSEDFSKAAPLYRGGVTFVPTCLVVERPDLVLKNSQLGQDPLDWRQRYVSIVSFIRAASSELGPSDMRAFRDELLNVVYDSPLRKIGNTGIIKEKQTGQCRMSPEAHDVFAQEIIFRIDYLDNVGDYFLPTT